jgi:osmotically-inducible protein OsmY
MLTQTQTRTLIPIGEPSTPTSHAKNTRERKNLSLKRPSVWGDGWLWTKTRAVLATTDDLRDSTINVDVDNAVVTLSGTVATQAQKTKAAQVAKSVEGVKSVRNNLTVSANP